MVDFAEHIIYFSGVIYMNIYAKEDKPVTLIIQMSFFLSECPTYSNIVFSKTQPIRAHSYTRRNSEATNHVCGSHLDRPNFFLQFRFINVKWLLYLNCFK